LEVVMELKDLLGVLSPIVTIAGFWLVTRRNWKQDDTSNGREMGVLLTEVGAIKSSLAELTRKFDTLEERYSELRERVAMTERDVKSAHRRLDELGGKEARGE
jgi:hypothetical protein